MAVNGLRMGLAHWAFTACQGDDQKLAVAGSCDATAGARTCSSTGHSSARAAAHGLVMSCQTSAGAASSMMRRACQQTCVTVAPKCVPRRPTAALRSPATAARAAEPPSLSNCVTCGTADCAVKATAAAQGRGLCTAL